MSGYYDDTSARITSSEMSARARRAPSVPPRTRHQTRTSRNERLGGAHNCLSSRA